MVIALGLLIPVAILGGLGALIYFLVRGGRGDDAFTSRTLLRAYLRLAYMVSLVVFLIGVINLLTAGFATAFGQDFSYMPQASIAPAPSCQPPAAGAGADAQAAYQNCVKQSSIATNNSRDTRQQDDLIRGLSLLISGLVLGAGHRLGQLAMETPQERQRSGLARTEALLGTVAFGLVTFVAVPLATYTLLHHAILGNQVTTNGTPDAPGSGLAVALVFLPAWLYYLYTFVRGARRTGAVTPA